LQHEYADGYDMAMFSGAGGPEGALVKVEVYVSGKVGPVLYFRADDLDVVLARANQAGGRTLCPEKDIGPNGWVSELEESEVNRIALIQPR
jgi:uncharacterized protein